MAYAHYIHEPPLPFAVVMHAKELETASGLISGSVILGHTALHGKPTELVIPDGLEIPSLAEVLAYGNIADIDLTQYDKRVECTTLDEFRDKGIEILTGLTGKISDIVKVEHILYKKEPEQSAKSNLRTRKSASVYRASTDELNSLERIESAVNRIKVKADSTSTRDEDYPTTYL